MRPEFLGILIANLTLLLGFMELCDPLPLNPPHKGAYRRSFFLSGPFPLEGEGWDGGESLRKSVLDVAL